MSKKERLQLLLERLNSLEGQRTSSRDLEKITGDLIRDEVDKLTEQLKASSGMRALQELNTELKRLRKEFDTKPIMEVVQQIQKDVEESEEQIIKDMTTRLGKLSDMISGLRSDVDDRIGRIDIPDLKSAMEDLRIEFDSKVSLMDQSELRDDIQNLQKQMLDMAENGIELDKELRESFEKNIERRIKEIRAEVLSRISSNHGGNANRNVTMNGQSVLGMFTDYNLKDSSTIAWTASNDINKKRADFTAAAAGGLAVESIGITIDGGGSTITTGAKGQITIPYAATINNWYIVNKTATAGESGSIVIDVKRSGTSIVGAGNKPTVTTTTGASAAVSSWTSTAIAAGDILEFNVDSVTTFTWVNLVLKVTKT